MLALPLYGPLFLPYSWQFLVTMPTDWPPGAYDRDAMEYFLEKLMTKGRDATG
jgi:hypothetical protein